jgi:hypothetical protein
MTGRQDDRQDDRQRILDEYMIDKEVSTRSYKLTYNDHGNRNDDCDAAGDRTTDSSQQKQDDLEQRQ